MIINEELITRLFIPSPSSGMYKIEHRIPYQTAIHEGVYINDIPTILQHGQPHLWIDKTEAVYRGLDKIPLLYVKITYLYFQDIRQSTVSDNLREGYDQVRPFFEDWCKAYDPTVFKNKRYGLAKLHKRPDELYQSIVIGLRPIADSVNMRHPLMKGVGYDPDLVNTFHDYMPPIDTDEDMITFLFPSATY